MFNNKALITPLGLVGITILSGAFLMSANSFATDNTDVVDNVNITVPVSCSLEGTGMTSHNANIVNGTYQADIGSTTLKAFCNDTNGFAIYAIGFTDDEYGKTVLTNSILGSTYDIATGTATSGNTSNWAMKLATDGTATYAITLDNSFNAYHNVPTTYTKVAHRDSGTDIGAGATGAELTSTYAAYMNQTQPAGTYVGKVIYTLVHPANETPAQPVTCDPGKICYNPNTATALGEMGKQSVYNYAPTTLWSPNFKRDGYGFAGWNTAYDYSGTNYGPNQTITAPADVQTNGLSLYAVWIKSAGTIQNWDGCSSLAQGSTTALTDERDGNTYAVAKLADNKCWMIENLRLDDTPELSAANTHNPSLPLNNSWFYENRQGALTTSDHLSVASDPTSTNPDTAWCMTESPNCSDQSMLATNNTTLFTNNTSSSYNPTNNVYSYGNYYNWYSATAGYGTYDSTIGTRYTAPGDICPAGWHLPTGDVYGANNFVILDIALGGTGTDSYSSTTPTGETMSLTYRAYPNNFVYSGHVAGSSVYSTSRGGYWSASGDGTSANVMDITYSTVYPGTGNGTRYAGRVIRCIAGV